jgi:predicted MFS family arabinose efflux permease
MSPSSSYDRRWLILALIATAQLMIVLDLTIVNIALPSAQRDLGFSNDERQWIVTSYALAFGSLLLLGGKLGDLFGRKWAFIGGLAGFAAASAVGGAAESFGVLVGARAAPGVFAALLAPSALALLAVTFSDPGERGKAFGIYGAVAGGGSAVGLLLGGILTEWLTWRWCLYVNLRDRRAATDRERRAGRARAARPGRHHARHHGAVRARLRLLELRVALVGAPGDHHRAAARRRAAHRIRGRRVAC